MTTNDIDAIEARANAATPGPWGETSLHDLLRFGRKNDGGWDQHEETMPVDGDEEFICPARQDVPALCAEVRELRAALSECERIRQLEGQEYISKASTYDAAFLGVGVQLADQVEELDKLRAALERARALAGQMQVYAEGMEEELNSFGVVIVATVRAFGDKIAAALGEGGRP